MEAGAAGSARSITSESIVGARTESLHLLALPHLTLNSMWCIIKGSGKDLLHPWTDFGDDLRCYLVRHYYTTISIYYTTELITTPEYIFLGDLNSAFLDNYQILTGAIHLLSHSTPVLHSILKTIQSIGTVLGYLINVNLGA